MAELVSVTLIFLTWALVATEAALAAVEQAIRHAQSKGLPVVQVQHVADPAQGIAPFFNADTEGVKIHPRILAAAPDAPVVVKHYAARFELTNEHAKLQALG
jgi:hypothetical protein